MEEKAKLVLNLVDNKAYNECLNVLNSNFTSDVLQNMVELLRRWLLDKKVIYIADNGKETGYLPVSSYFIMKKHCKDDALKFLAVFLADADNCLLMINSFPEIIRELLRRCTDNFFVLVNDFSRHKEVNRILCKSEEWGNSRYEVCCPLFSLVRKVDDNHVRHTFLQIDRFLFPYFYGALHRQDEHQAEKELPQELCLKELLTELSAVRNFSFVRNLYDQDEIEVNKKGMITASALKRCVQQLGDFDEFFPEAQKSVLTNFRASFYFFYLYYRLSNFYLRTSKREVTLESILRDVANTLLPPQNLLIGIVFPHISGNFSNLDLTNAHYLFLDILADLNENARVYEEKWISVDEVIKHILTKEHGYTHCLLFSKYDFFYDKIGLKNSKVDKKFIELSRFRTDLLEPYVKAIFLMMASVGLLDIAYRDYREDDRTWVDWLKYVRVTNLGKYILGISHSYHPQYKVKNIKYCEIDTEYLVVRSLVDKNPFDLYLQEVAKPIGNHRYIFTEESFIRKCSVKKDVEKKVDFFKKNISSELPPVWSDFFTNVIEKCNPLVSLKPMAYSIFQVEPENKALVHLLNSDPVLRKIIIRAEGFIFMIKKTDCETFYSRMKEWGYII